MAKLLVLVVVLFAGVVVAAVFFQARVLFPAHQVPPAGPLPPGAEHLMLETADGQRLHGVHFPPAVEARSPTLILGFGGNVWNAEDAAATLHALYSEAHVVAVHYRGYRPSTGRPTVAALLADAPLVYDAAVALVQPARIVAVGLSVGSGVAAGLARQRRLNGLILVTPFDSLKAVAADLFPWLPVKTFFAHELDAPGNLEGSQVPVAIVAAGRDEVIRRERTKALRARVKNLVFDRTIEGASHNDLYAHPGFRAAMRQALRAVTS